MPLDLSTVRDYLSQVEGRTVSRKMFIFAGDENWHAEITSQLLHGYESQSLWVSDKEMKNNIPSTSIKHAHHWLGGEKKIVIFDAVASFDVDAFAAISGIVMGGGFFILLMPEKEYWEEIYFTHFGERLRQHINSSTEIIVINETDNKIDFNHTENAESKLQDCMPPFLTHDQQDTVETIEADIQNKLKNAFVIVSDRGRGKSAALGLLAARLLKSGVKNIAITAPRFRATGIIFKHLQQQLPDAGVTRGCIKFGECTVQFYPPDLLLQSDIEIELLLVDEAAAIPVPILTSCLKKFPQCVFATTVHGYEGTGRGFSLRFNKVLTQHKPGWIKLQLQTPIRWPENDFLEKWMFSLLCMDADIVEASVLGSIELENLKHKKIKQNELLQNETLLNEIFSLLVLAHYRTRPSDLINLLDNETLSLYVTMKQHHVIAVALVIREGSFTDALSSEVYRGERRPQGHLLAQALTYHCGIEHAATRDYARVMRIAVHPELQQQGIGTQLLDYIVSCERSRGCDAIGTSFGMNKLLLDFWRQAGFDLVRLGFTREQTSGEHAAIMLLPLSDAGKKINFEAARRFVEQISYWLDDVLKDIPDEIKKQFPGQVNEYTSLNSDEKKDLRSFLQTSRNYELCISALNKLVMLKQDVIMNNNFESQNRLILNSKVLYKQDWKSLAEALDFKGKDEARIKFKDAIKYLIEFSDKNFI